MTKEDKELLLADLCGYLPYGLKVTYPELGSYMPDVWDVTGIPEKFGFVDITAMGKFRYAAVPVEKIKPYLRPMSSMTEEETIKYNLLANHCIVTSVGFIHLEANELMDWLNKKMFDYRGLIEKGLALEATEDMYKEEQQ